jgi:hypothetical protein
MSSIEILDKAVNDAILSGGGADAFETYYAENVVMIEPDGAFEGKEANRKREIEFYENVAKWHGGKLINYAINGNVSFSQWWFDIEFRGDMRFQMEQVAVRTWENGLIVQERFYYNKEG